jgi:hypothetical protein
MKFTNTLSQQFPTFFHLRTPWQPTTVRIGKMFNIVAVIINLYVVTVNT